MPRGSWLIDSNVLLRWVKADDRDFGLVRGVLDVLLQQRESLYYTSQNVAEFWNTCTRPVERNGFGLGLEEADARARLFEDEFSLLADNISVHEEWRRLIVQHRVSGIRVHDARLVASMKVYDVESILTFNGADFLRYPGIRVMNPRTMAL